MRGKQKTLALLQGNHLRKRLLLGTVSGVATTKTTLVEYVDRELPALGLITTKSYQLVPNSGNREPIITEPITGSFGNSVGLRNPGLKIALAELKNLRARVSLRSILNVSVSASTRDDFITLVKAFADVADCIELNFSCPHAEEGYGASIGCDPYIAGSYMKAIREAVGDDFPSLIIPKMTPNTEHIGNIAAALISAGADGISAINTVGPEQYLEPHTGSPILNNTLGGKGGKSGEWIRSRALEVIKEIRSVVGDDIPIIGMGGVSSASDAVAMIVEGADTVGLGSVFGRVHQRDWNAFTNALYSDAQYILKNNKPADSSSAFLCCRNQMKYDHHNIINIIEHNSKVKTIYTDGKLECGPGQYVFIWLPGVGEKPFSVAETNPVSFIIKNRGPFTQAVLNCRVGDTLYVRGVYGESLEIADTKKAIILAGGTGIAVVPSLAKKLHASGTRVSTYYGVSGNHSNSLLQEELSIYGEYTAVSDNGTPGRVIDIIEEEISDVSDMAFYTIGPEEFMIRAAAVMTKKGINEEQIFLSLERPSLCGMGMCGECACGDRLTCQYGTFVRLDFLKEHAPELL